MISGSSNTTPRIALFGVTGYASIYYQIVREWLANGSVSFVAAVVINQDQVPDVVAELNRLGVRIYASAENFFEAEKQRIDLCLIPVGIQWHARLTISALHAGMHVLVEKPLAGSIDDAQAIRRAEEQTGRWVAVGFQDIYSTEVQLLKQRICAGAIGRIESVRLIGLWPRARSYFTRNNWAGKVSSDGAATLDSPLNNAFAHFVNLSLFLLGNKVDESARATVQWAQVFRAHDIEMFDTAVVRGAVESGARFWFGVSHATGETREPEVLIQGEDGQIAWKHEHSYTITDRSGRTQTFSLPSTQNVRRQMFAAVLSRLINPDAFVCTTAMAEEHTRLIESIQIVGVLREFPSDSVSWIKDSGAGSEIPIVNGLAGRLDRAFESESSLMPTDSADPENQLTPVHSNLS